MTPSNTEDPGSSVDVDLHELHARVDELGASRARLTTAADAERRTIERELHDGAQQYLVAAAVNLQLARELIECDLRAALTLLDEIGDDVRRALDGIRAVAQRAYPPLLADRGLGEALSAAALASEIPVRVEADRRERYPEGVEAAVYFCCVEALKDAAERAGAGARATVRVWRDGRSLRVEVTDDPGAARAGSFGSSSQAATDRIGAVGGILVVTKLGAGALVAGCVPLPP